MPCVPYHIMKIDNRIILIYNTSYSFPCYCDCLRRFVAWLLCVSGHPEIATIRAPAMSVPIGFTILASPVWQRRTYRTITIIIGQPASWKVICFGLEWVN